MERAITWYEVLGVLPGADPDKIKRKYDERASLLRPEMISGAPANVLAVVTRAQYYLDTAWAILGDPARRSRYDETAGLRGQGLTASGSFASGSWTGPSATAPPVDLGADGLSRLLGLDGPSGSRSRTAKRAQVPELRGLFYDVCMEMAGRLGLKVRSVQLTPHPMPVDGLVVDQAPRPPGKLRRDETLMAHVWHPPIRPGP
jgi:curved DNA-binding protein CbpA